MTDGGNARYAFQENRRHWLCGRVALGKQSDIVAKRSLGRRQPDRHDRQPSSGRSKRGVTWMIFNAVQLTSDQHNSLCSTPGSR